MDSSCVGVPERIFAVSAKKRVRIFIPMGIAAFAGVAIPVWEKPSARVLGIAVMILASVGCLFGFIWWAQNKIYPGRSIELFKPSGAFRFRGFRFKTKFWPEGIRDSICLAPGDILGISVIQNRGTELGFSLRTIAGVVTVSSAIEGYEQLKYLFSLEVERTQSDAQRYNELISHAPAIRTPWYGWVILITLLGACGFSIYFFGMR